MHLFDIWKSLFYKYYVSNNRKKYHTKLFTQDGTIQTNKSYLEKQMYKLTHIIQ